MAVMISKDKRNLYIDCDCGCGTGVRFQIDKDADDDMYFLMSHTSCNWYTHQDNKVSRVIGRKIKAIVNIIRNKDYHCTDICMSKDDFKEFQKYISNIE